MESDDDSFLRVAVMDSGRDCLQTVQSRSTCDLKVVRQVLVWRAFGCLDCKVFARRSMVVISREHESER